MAGDDRSRQRQSIRPALLCLVKRWRTLADPIEKYTAPAAEAYRQAATDLEKEIACEAGDRASLRWLADMLADSVVARLGQPESRCLDSGDNGDVRIAVFRVSLYS